MSIATTPAAPPARGRRGTVVTFTGLMLVMLMAALDQTIVATALPTIVRDLGGLAHISWVVTAYLLAQTAVTPIYGKLGDLYGRKAVLEVGLVVFLVGSGLCGLAQNLTELVAFRALQGLGGGGLMVSTMAAIGDVVPPRDRGRYQGLFGAVFGLASVIGPLLGGVFTSTLSWRWIFYVNLPLGVLALGVLATTLPRATETIRRQVDYVGAALLACGLTAIVLACTLGGTTYGWGSPLIVALGAIAVGALVLFWLAERRAKEPVLPLRLFANRVFSVTSGIGLVVGFALFGSVTYLPLFLQVVTGASPTGSGLQILPLMGGLLLTSIASGQIISRTGRYRRFPIAGTAIMVVGLVLLSTMDADTTRLAASAKMFVLGLGLGMVMQVLVLAVQNSVAYEDLGVATSGASLFRSIGGSVGTAVLGSIFTNRLNSELPASLSSGGARLGTAGSVHAHAGGSLNVPASASAAYIHAFANALSTVFEVAAAVAAVAFLLSWLLEEKPLRDTIAAGSGVGESFAMPKGTDSLAEAARALTRLVGRDRRRLLVERLAERAGVELSAAACWLIVRLDENPSADLVALCDSFGVPVEVAATALGELQDRDLVAPSSLNDDGVPVRRLTPPGEAIADRLVAARHAALARLCEDWVPDEHEDLTELLRRLAHELVAVPDSEAGVTA